MGRRRLPADNPYTKSRRKWNKGVLKSHLYSIFSKEELQTCSHSFLLRKSMGLLSPFSKEARSGLSLNTTKQKETHFPFPALPRAARPARPLRKGKTSCSTLHRTAKANCTEKCDVRDFTAARPGSGGHTFLDHRQSLSPRWGILCPSLLLWRS